MIIVFAKIFSVFCISLLGYIANKIKWLPAESTKYLSMLLFNITSPCLIIYAMSRQELTRETVSSVAQTAGLMLLALVIATVFVAAAVRIMKMPAEDRGVYQIVLFLTNCGFMGFPLALAVFGEKGLFLMIIANAVFTLYTYSVGVLLLISGKEEKLALKTALKSMSSVPVISSIIGLLIFALGIPLPQLMSEFLDIVGSVTIPLSMIIIGVQLAESKVGEVLENKHIFQTLILKLVVLPAVLFGILIWLPVNSLVFCIVIFAMAMPSAAVIPVISEIYGANTKLAAQIVFITTMFSLITIPIISMILYPFSRL